MQTCFTKSLLTYTTILLALFFSFNQLQAVYSAPTLPLDERYALELSDPHHRHISVIKPVYDLWINSQQEAFPDFWTFVETQKDLLIADFPTVYDPSFFMTWLQNDERQPYKVSFKSNQEGQIQLSTPHDGVIQEGKWMFIQKGEDLFAAQEKTHQFHHVSLAAGEDVDSAGTFSVKKGRLASISFISGHYRPTYLQGLHTVSTLESLGLNLAQIKIACYIPESASLKKKKFSFNDFIKLEVEEFPKSDPKPAEDLFLVSFSALDNTLDKYTFSKAELFLNDSGELFLGSTKLQNSDPLLQLITSLVVKASVNIQDGKITKIIFTNHLEQLGELKKIQTFVEALIVYGIKVEEIKFRIIENHQKKIVSAQDILSYSSL